MMMANPEHMERVALYDSHFPPPLSANTDQLQSTIMLADKWEEALKKVGEPLQYLAARHLSAEKGKATQTTSAEGPSVNKTNLTGKPR